MFHIICMLEPPKISLLEGWSLEYMVLHYLCTRALVHTCSHTAMLRKDWRPSLV
jgi:hypothetical protein